MSHAFRGPRPAPVPARLVAALAASLPFAVAVPSVAAQSAVAPATVPLTGVTVTATRTPTRIDGALAEVTVLERADIERATGRTLADLLGRQPGVQTWSNGGLGKPASVSIRGLEARHVLLLVDGVRMGTATVGTPSWDNLPLSSIERIEIVRGPLSSLYGSDAVAGVVQVFTRQGTEGLRPDASATAGSHGYRQGTAGLRGAAGPVTGSVQLQALDDDGRSATNPRVPFGAYNGDTDGFRQRSANARVGLALPAGWRLDGTALESRGESQYDDGPGADARARLLNRAASLTAAGPLGEPWRTRLALSRSEDVYETLASASRFATLGATTTRQTQVSWENTLGTRAGTLLLLVDRLEQEVSRPGTNYTVSQRTVTGLGAGLDGEAGRHRWQAALRRDRNSQFGSPTTGTLAYGFDATPQLRLGASAGTSFVAPSFNQLYFPGFGNPNLLPEEGVHREASLRWTDDGHSVRAAWFANRIRGYIASGPLPVNVPRARMDGLSLSWAYVLGDWTYSASGELLEPLNDTAGSANFGRQLPRRAAESVRVALDRRLGRWTVGASAEKVGSRFEDAANTQPIAGYTRVDLRADWTIAGDWTLGLRLNNATDRRYETALGYDQPRREAFVTLRWSPR
jgi:vitamin B12 transporter